MQRDVPIGGIVAWSGSIASIPARFVICDGNNGTPNLINRFVVGAGDTYTKDDTGGQILHGHDFTGNVHSHFLTGTGQTLAGFNYATITDLQPSTGTTDNSNGLAPYYSLAYIQYKGV